MTETLEVITRVLISVILLFAITRLLKNRSLGSLTYFDYVAAAILGTIAGNLAFNTHISIYTFTLALSVMTIVVMLISNIAMLNRPARKFLAGTPTPVISNGRIMEASMHNLNYSYDYLLQQLRLKQVFDISQVHTAILEPNGELSVLLYPENSPLTPSDIHLHPQALGLAVEVILDGQILEQNLRKLNRDLVWLGTELKKRGIDNTNSITFAAISTNGKLYIDFRQDDF